MMNNALVLLPLLFLAQTVSAAAVLPDDEVAERVAACAACHGEQGEGRAGSEYYPHLAGKPAGYLFVQMQGFRDGRRHYPEMVYLMRNWDDAWLARIAAFYAGRAVVTPQHVPVAALPEAERDRAEGLVQQGDPARELPACAACHGARLNGIEPGVPALAGLPVDYLIAQLGGWLTGARHSLAPECMAEVVGRLEPGEIRLLASYIAGQMPEEGSRPAVAGSWDLPLHCGGAGDIDPPQGAVP